ncbi:hypothetical protein [Streptomyces kanamyceticus]|uniref:Uncharacterized protein n=1 Tax=Streptomyces kanamyceticus TaxID=1967 RepID=A0A5J6GRK9_STRKN|nr:hypothetical protein [Streptomyces kanamyceticus]QEU96645.1 hypothetical protein CP970_41960 [Streptomyces kanamyceticus]
MDSSYPGQSRRERREHHAPPCEQCDLSGMDDLACESKGVADRAAYLARYADALKERRAAYDTARAAYTTARTAVTADVANIRKELHQLREQLRCQLDRHTVECLDEAWHDVAERLEHCGEPRTGCCVEECDFDDERESCEDDDLDELTARIARVDRIVTAAEACFTVLAGEPGALTQRVADLKAAVTALLAAVSDPTTADLRHAYATLRWLWHRYDDIWWGFPRVHDFHNCLCQALTCSVTGRRVLGILTGRLGVLTCRKDAADQRCAMLRAHVVEEILEACARACHPEGGGKGEREEVENESEGEKEEKGSVGEPRAETGQSADREEKPHSTW